AAEAAGEKAEPQSDGRQAEADGPSRSIHEQAAALSAGDRGRGARKGSQANRVRREPSTHAPTGWLPGTGEADRQVRGARQRRRDGATDVEPRGGTHPSPRVRSSPGGASPSSRV